MQSLEAESVDLVVTSPPYNLGVNYDTYKDKGDRESFVEWCNLWIAEVKRVMKDDASFFLNVGSAPANPHLPHQLALALTEGEDALFTLQNTFHWIKSISIETRAGELVSAGHFKPINSKRYVNDCHEYIFHLTKTGTVPLARKEAGVPYADKSNITRWSGAEKTDKRCRGNTWFLPYDTIKNKSKDRPHPATFPVALVEQCIRIHGKGEETDLLDPFNGIGTSALAACRMNISSYIGFDIDEGYLDVARARISNEQNA